MEKVAFIIPTFNEALSIEQVINRVPLGDLQKDYKIDIYVVDGRSSDGTVEIARANGAHILFEQRKGKGIALQTAFKLTEADYYIIADGDNTYPVEVIPQMLRLLRTNDVVVGSRLKGVIEPGAMTTLNTFGNMMLTLLARLLFKTYVSDVCTGLWGFRGETVKRLELQAHGFEIEADMYAECARMHLRMTEIPITYGKRVDQAKLASFSDGLKIGAFLIRRWRRNHAREREHHVNDEQPETSSVFRV